MDMVRVTVLWNVVADSAKSGTGPAPALQQARRRQPEGLSEAQLGPLRPPRPRDRASSASSPYFDVTWPGPSWAHGRAAALRAREPQDVEAQADASSPSSSKAVGKRYDGTYKDENDHHAAHPARVRVVAGQRAQPGRLADPAVAARQARTRRACTARCTSPGAARWTDRPRRRRDLHRRDRAAGQLEAHVALARAPEAVHRAAALRARGHTDGGCSDFDKYGPLQATGWAHHPYTKRLPPLQPRLQPGLDHDGQPQRPADAARPAGRPDRPHRAAACRSCSTEFGYETNPPDPYVGDLARQAGRLPQRSATSSPTSTRASRATRSSCCATCRRCASTPRPSRHYWFTYQSGLFTRSGKPKPSAQAYAFPFLAQPTGTPLHRRTCGASCGSDPTTSPKELRTRCRSQFKPADGSADWAPLGSPITVTNGRGFFTGQVTAPAAGIAARQLDLGAVPSYFASQPRLPRLMTASASARHGRACRAARRCAAAAANASRVQRSIFEDDQTLVLSSADDPRAHARRPRDARRRHGALGRVLEQGRPRAAEHAPPGRLRRLQPRRVPAALWDRYDGLVRGAQARGMDVLLSPSSPMPGLGLAAATRR